MVLTELWCEAVSRLYPNEESKDSRSKRFTSLVSMVKTCRYIVSDGRDGEVVKKDGQGKSRVAVRTDTANIANVKAQLPGDSQCSQGPDSLISLLARSTGYREMFFTDCREQSAQIHCLVAAWW